MKHVDEYRELGSVRRCAEAIRSVVTRDWTIMEICGGQTHAIVKYGLEELLPRSVTLVHGPGCPVCVTPLAQIDRAIALARRPGVILTSFGDMLRVPGSSGSLLTAKAEGADVRMVYSPLEALLLAEAEPTREVVFFAVGFETTAPANAAAVDEARRRGLPNFSILAAHVRVPPAMEAILGSPGCRVRGFLAAGHVCTVMGFEEYEPIADRYRVPIVVTGFEPLDLLQGIYLCCRQLERGEAKVENQYTRAVRREGNRKAQELMRRVFSVGTQTWRGIGEIPGSGLVLAPAFEAFDAERKFGLPPAEVREPESCRSGQVLQGLLRPNECPEFAGRCTPETPLGAPMVSSEGACAAYFLYGRKEEAR